MNFGLSIGIGVLCTLALCQVRPPNYSPDLLPDTSFTCEDKVSGSYYADVEASCQLFHVCVQVSEYEFQDFHFLCPNDTVFDQQHLVCTNWFDVDCQQSTQFFPHDFAFDKAVVEDEYQYENEYSEYDDRNSNENDNKNPGTQSFLGFSQPALSSGLNNGGRGQNQVSRPLGNPDQNFDYYEEDEDVRGRIPQSPQRGNANQGFELSNPPIATTPIPLGFTTTRRPLKASPRVKSNIVQRNKNRGGPPKSGNRVEDDKRKFTFTAPEVENNKNFEDATEKPVVNPFDNPPFISADGKKPRVKANINNRIAISGNTQNKSKPKKQGSKKVELDRSQFSKIDFVKPSFEEESTDSPFLGPEVRPDGRLPRVKANVLAATRDQGQAHSSPPSFVPFVTTSRPSLLRDQFNQNIDADFNTQSVSPTSRSFVPFKDVTTESSRFNSFRPFKAVSTESSNFNSFQPFSAEPPLFSIETQSPNDFNFRATTKPPATFSPFTFTQTPRQQTIPSKFDLGPPPQPEIPPSLQRKPTPSFNLGPPPQQKLPPSLPRNRNRFGSRPRVKANELAQRANVGSRKNNFRESPRNNFAQDTELPDARNTNEIQSGLTTRRPRPRPETKLRFRTTNLNDIPDSEKACTNPFKCPPSRVAGGRKPRVKSNIKAQRRNYWNPRKSRVIKKRKQVKLNAKLWKNIRKGRKQTSTEDKSNAIDNTIDDEPITTPDPISSLQQIVASKEKNPKTFEVFPPARSFQNKRLRSKQKINHRGRSAFQRTATQQDDDRFTAATTPVSPLQTEPSKFDLGPAPQPEIPQSLQRKPTPKFNLGPPPQPKIPKQLKNRFNLGPPPQPKLPSFLRPPTNRRFNAATTPRSFKVPETAAPTTEVSLFVTNPNFIQATTASPPKEKNDDNELPISLLPVSNPTQTAPQNPFTVSDMGLFVTNPRALPDHHNARDPFIDPPKKIRDGRRPRVKSNIMAKLQNRPGPIVGPPVESSTEVQTTTEKILPVLRINPDGRSPRVKSNLKKKNKHKNKNNRNNKDRLKHSRVSFGRSLDLEDDSKNEIQDVRDIDSDDYDEPEVRPDGRKPRIKSNIKAKETMNGKQSSRKKKNKNKSFRHSKKVSKPSASAFNKRTPFEAPNDLIDDLDNAITTFRPVISLEHLMSTNETFPEPPPELSVPLPNFDKSIINSSDRERFAGVVFKPTPRGFQRQEPAFSDFPKTSLFENIEPRGDFKQTVQSATEIVRVSSKDQNLFNSDYNYEDYYYQELHDVSHPFHHD